jgi:hypothetical protein
VCPSRALQNETASTWKIFRRLELEISQRPRTGALRPQRQTLNAAAVFFLDLFFVLEYRIFEP